MKVLVTGGTGYLGQAVVRALAARGHEPTVFARTAAASGLPGRLVSGDVRDIDALGRAAAGCEAICHMAALVALWRPRREDFDEVNVGGLRHVLQVAAARGIPRILYTSSFLALPPSDGTAALRANDYQRTKVDAERVAAEGAAAGSPIVRLYPGVVYGPGPGTEGNLVGRLLADHLRGRLPGLIGADHLWSYAYVDDVAAGHVAALDRGRPGVAYRLGGANVPQIRLFELVRALTGRALPRRIPYGVAHAIGLAEELRARIFHGAPVLTRGTVEIFRHDWALDSTLAAGDLGYTMTALEDGLARTLAAVNATAA
ncbi:MAG TPA: NAD-dependent epimerase/dehydratase family protein [Vicinamibacterales bacterium]|nr:NAD-dependent epimerase/dehydratase family protein [Vicinamibacterales bacterium]